MENYFKKIPLRKRIIIGVSSGIFFAVFMASFDYFDGSPFSVAKFLFHSLFFGLFMSIALRYKVPKDQN
ncbi:hypothetical protein [Winogradskyella thalassocola]|uniref:Uncharacterized protein n=1 Tax=Winogradskyella thalassocola TaxID=262004 RepID=A0A1G8IWK6_9FLAO|nr:hypothetical protein [Winogradskyella thalassocola]SDI23374.1 hypothetical protein SAMN04489796_108104 [Winogradskyella thalassocola]